MTKSAIVNNSTKLVENIVLGIIDVPTGYTCVSSDTANIGDTYINSVFIPPVGPSPSLDQQKATITNQLTDLDKFLPRGLEDFFTATYFDVTELPKIQQQRLQQKVALRAQLKALST